MIISECFGLLNGLRLASIIKMYLYLYHRSKACCEKRDGFGGTS